MLFRNDDRETMSRTESEQGVSSFLQRAWWNGSLPQCTDVKDEGLVRHIYIADLTHYATNMIAQNATSYLPLT